MLGSFRLYLDGAPVTDWHGSRGQRIARYLLAHRRRPVPKERLIELIWPDVPPEVGRRNLHQAIYCLRSTLRAAQPEEHHIVLEGDCYRLNPDLDVWCDVEEFEADIDAGRRLTGAGRVVEAIASYRAAERLYGGEFLEDTPYEEWAIGERERLDARYAQALLGMTVLHLDRGGTDEAIASARTLLMSRPADETAHQLIIRAHLSNGRRVDALAQYRCCAGALEREFGLAPGEEITALCGPLLAPAATRLAGHRNGHLAAE
jgi:DNA-binding SARP family transcriptional activator